MNLNLKKLREIAERVAPYENDGRTVGVEVYTDSGWAEHSYRQAFNPQTVLKMIELLEKLSYLQEIRQHGCECSDDDACLFVKQRDELRALLAEALKETNKKRNAPQGEESLLNQGLGGNEREGEET